MDLIILVGVFLVFLVINAPIAFALGLGVLGYLLFTGDFPLFVVAHRMSSSLVSFPLLAIPLFILAGGLMNTSGITRRIFDFASTLVRHLPGGLAQVNIVASMIFAGMSGSAIADAGGLGAVEMKAMKDRGYKPAFAAAVTAASSAVGPIIPPSLVLIVYGVMAEVSVGRLFLGGLIPGVITGVVLMAYIHRISGKRGFPRETRASSTEVLLAARGAVLPLLTPLIILGGITLGVFTPTEAGVIAVIYALILGLFYKEIAVRDIPRVFKEAVVSTSSVMFIVTVASAFGWLIINRRIPDQFAEFLLEFTSSPVVILLLLNVFLFLLGMFMETISVLVMITPILVSLSATFGFDPVHIGVLTVLNLMVGIITPPVGMCLFVVSDTGKVPVGLVMREALPFLVPLSVSVVIVTYFPGVVTWLPKLLMP